MNEISMSNKISINTNEATQSSNSNEKIESNVIFNNLNQNIPQNENDIKHCLICGQLIELDKEKEVKKVKEDNKENTNIEENKENKKHNEKNTEQTESNDIQNAFTIQNKLCNKCKGPFKHVKYLNINIYLFINLFRFYFIFINMNILFFLHSLEKRKIRKTFHSYTCIIITSSFIKTY